MPYSRIIFDFDGTLVDTLAHSIAAFQRIAPRFRLNLDFDLATARSLPTRELFKRMGVRFWTLPRLVRAFQDEVAFEADRWKLFPGIADELHRLTHRGCQLGILSSNREESIRTCLRSNGVEDRFAFIVGYPRFFGKARALRRILKDHRIAPDSALYIGDETRDIQAAHRTRIASAAVIWGFHTEELLSELQPRFLLRNPTELQQFP